MYSPTQNEVDVRRCFVKEWRSSARRNLKAIFEKLRGHPEFSALAFDLAQINLDEQLLAGDQPPLFETQVEILNTVGVTLAIDQLLELARLEYDRRWDRGEIGTRSVEFAERLPETVRTEVLTWRPCWSCPNGACHREQIRLDDESAATAECPGCKRRYAISEVFQRENAADLDLRDYELEELVGRGGMGEVYRSRDPSLDRELAIKVIHQVYFGDPALEARFRREAQIAGALQHPGIVPIYNRGRLKDRRPFFTMELIRGVTFAQKLKALGADLSQRLGATLTNFVQVCQAMAYAHQRGYIHRDLKPDNIMVGQFGEVQIMDWGLAKNLSEQIDDVTFPASPRILGDNVSVAGQVLGTPLHMSPEQAGGDSRLIGKPSDVFSMGIMLCEILTQAPPYLDLEEYQELCRIQSIKTTAQEASSQCLPADAGGRTSHADDAHLRELAKLIKQRAQVGDTSRGRSRLQKLIPLEPELVRLTELCLEANPSRRPTDAQQVAQALLTYQELLRKRAEDELVQREKREEAEKRESAERNLRLKTVERNRVAKWLAATFAVLLVGTVAASIQIYRQAQNYEVISIKAGKLADDRGKALDDLKRESDERAWAQDKAIQNEHLSRWRLSEQLERTAVDLIHDGDTLRALNYLVPAMRIKTELKDEGAVLDNVSLADAVEANRMRIEFVIQSAPRLTHFQKLKKPVASAHFVPGGQQVVIDSWGIHLWNLNTNELRPYPTGYWPDVLSPWSWSPALADGSKLLGSAGFPCLLDPNTFKLDREFPQLAGYKWGTVDPTGKRIALIANQKDPPEIRFWNVVTGQLEEPFGLSNKDYDFQISSFDSIDWSVQGDWAMIANKSFKPVALERDDERADQNHPGGVLINPHTREQRWLNGLMPGALSPDGIRVALLDYHGSLHLRSVKTLKDLGVIGCDSNPEWVTFSPDGQVLATAAGSSTPGGFVELWSAGLDGTHLVGERITQPLKHKATCTRAIFSPDSQFVATISGGTGGGSEARVWKIDGGIPVTPPLPHASEVTTIQFDESGRRLLTASRDGTVRVWDLASQLSLAIDSVDWRPNSPAIEIDETWDTKAGSGRQSIQLQQHVDTGAYRVFNGWTKKITKLDCDWHNFTPRDFRVHENWSVVHLDSDNLALIDISGAIAQPQTLKVESYPYGFNFLNSVALSKNQLAAGDAWGIQVAKLGPKAVLRTIWPKREQTSTKAIPSPVTVSHLSFSPGGQFLAFVSREQVQEQPNQIPIKFRSILHCIEPDTGKAQFPPFTCPEESVLQIVWSDNEQFLAIRSERGLAIVSRESGQLRYPFHNFVQNIKNVRFSADSLYLVCVAGDTLLLQPMGAGDAPTRSINLGFHPIYVGLLKERSFFVASDSAELGIWDSRSLLPILDPQVKFDWSCSYSSDLEVSCLIGPTPLEESKFSFHSVNFAESTLRPNDRVDLALCMTGEELTEELLLTPSTVERCEQAWNRIQNLPPVYRRPSHDDQTRWHGNKLALNWSFADLERQFVIDIVPSPEPQLPFYVPHAMELSRLAPTVDNHAQAGYIAYQARDYPKSLRCFESALRLKPDNGSLLSFKALVHLAQNDRQAAAASIARSKASGDSGWVLTWAQATQLESQGDLKGAIELLSSPASKEVPPKLLYSIKGRLQVQAGDFTGAVESFGKTGRRLSIYDQLLLAYAQLGDEKYVDFYKTVAELLERAEHADHPGPKAEVALLASVAPDLPVDQLRLNQLAKRAEQIEGLSFATVLCSVISMSQVDVPPQFWESIVAGSKRPDDPLPSAVKLVQMLSRARKLNKLEDQLELKQQMHDLANDVEELSLNGSLDLFQNYDWRAAIIKEELVRRVRREIDRAERVTE